MIPPFVPGNSGACEVDVLAVCPQSPGRRRRLACDDVDDGRPRGEKWVPNPENLVKDGKMLKDVNGNVLLHKDLAGRDNVVVYLGKCVHAAACSDAHGLFDSNILSECTWKDKDKDRKRGSASGGESGVTDADDSGGTGGEDSEEARGRTAEKSDETPPLPPTSGKQPMWQETQDQKEDRCCKVMRQRETLPQCRPE